jgi:hypothetical protein
MSTMPIENLQLRALQQRGEIHKSVSDLRKKIANAREKLRFSKHAREHLAAASALASLVGAVSGYAVAGLFARE